MSNDDRESSAAESERSKHGRGCVLLMSGAMVLVFVVALLVHLYGWYWRSKFERRVEELRASGEPVTLEEAMALREPVADDENAALVLLDAYAVLDAVKGDYGEDLPWVIDSPLGVRRSAEMQAVVDSYLSDREAGMALVRDSARLPKSRYPLDLSDGPLTAVMNHLNGVRDAPCLFALSAGRHAAGGDADAVMADLATANHVGRSLGDEPFVMSGLVRWAVHSVWIDGLEQSLALCELPPAQLRRLRETLAAEEVAFDWHAATVVERVSGIWMAREPNDWGPPDWRELRMPELLLRSFSPSSRWRDGLFLLEWMERWVEAAGRPPRERLREAERLKAECEQAMAGRRSSYPVSDATAGLAPLHLKESVRHAAILRAARTALAVEEWRVQHGDWPDSLAQLVPEYLDAVPQDPFSDGEIVYRRTADGARVYSVGENAMDDEGITHAEVTAESKDAWDEKAWDLSFRLLDPQRRGAPARPFVQELLDSGVPQSDLEQWGLTEEKLRELGLGDEELGRLGYVR